MSGIPAVPPHSLCARTRISCVNSPTAHPRYGRRASPWRGLPPTGRTGTGRRRECPGHRMCGSGRAPTLRPATSGRAAPAAANRARSRDQPEPPRRRWRSSARTASARGSATMPHSAQAGIELQGALPTELVEAARPERLPVNLTVAKEDQSRHSRARLGSSVRTGACCLQQSTK